MRFIKNFFCFLLGSIFALMFFILSALIANAFISKGYLMLIINIFFILFFVFLYILINRKCDKDNINNIDFLYYFDCIYTTEDRMNMPCKVNISSDNDIYILDEYDNTNIILKLNIKNFDGIFNNEHLTINNYLIKFKNKIKANHFNNIINGLKK